jgi:hypothetical protein
MPKVPRKRDIAYRIVLSDKAVQYFDGFVLASVIHENQLIGRPKANQHLGQSLVGSLKNLLFVISGHNHG